MRGSCDLTQLVSNNDQVQTNPVLTRGFALHEKRKQLQESADIALWPAGIQQELDTAN